MMKGRPLRCSWQGANDGNLKSSCGQGKNQIHPTRTMNKKPNPGRRRLYHPRRSGPIHAAAGIAHSAANFYFLLAGGTAAQREAAQEWKRMFLNLRQFLTP
jgi:hypothetical protein